MKKNLNPASQQTLSGVRVLVGRARHQASALSAELERLGAQVVEIPFIEIRRPRSFLPLDAALKNIASYDWLILTSVNGVEALWERLVRLRIKKSGLSHLLIAAIGPATRKAIERERIKVAVVPREYIAESVVLSLRRRIKGKRVLLVRAKVARDVIPRELRQAGAQVDVVEAYETVVPRTSRARLRNLLADPEKQPDWITFTSSSTVRNFASLLGSAKRRVNSGARFASIGPVTSSTLRELGLRVDTEARKYTIPGLVQAIASARRETKTKSETRRPKLRE